MIGIAFGDDPAFDHYVGRAADHDQVLDITAPHQHETARIDGGAVENLQPVLPAAAGAQEGQRAAIADEAENRHEAGQRDADAGDRDQQASSIMSDDVFHAISAPGTDCCGGRDPGQGAIRSYAPEDGPVARFGRLTADLAVAKPVERRHCKTDVNL